jgi:beta-glucosidase/6-phospho-beta-glucosidase/beta-galactosidase
MTWYRDGELHFGLGVEDTFIAQTGPGERALDEYELTEHYEHWYDDLGLATTVGAEFLRWGIPWHRVGELGLRPIVDLLHYGTPLWLEREFANPDFAKHFAEYAVHAAERYGEVATDYTPVNEPMIHARFAGDIAYRRDGVQHDRAGARRGLCARAAWDSRRTGRARDIRSRRRQRALRGRR